MKILYFLFLFFLLIVALGKSWWERCAPLLISQESQVTVLDK